MFHEQVEFTPKCLLTNLYKETIVYMHGPIEKIKLKRKENMLCNLPQCGLIWRVAY